MELTKDELARLREAVEFRRKAIANRAMLLQVRWRRTTDIMALNDIAKEEAALVEESRRLEELAHKLKGGETKR